MELVKNKASGKYFVVLDDSGDEEFLVITPEGKVKCLERRLFVPQETAPSRDRSRLHRLTRMQMDKYTEYLDG